MGTLPPHKLLTAILRAHGKKTSPRPGSPQAPEMLLGERCSQKVDVFALGVIIWELCTGESPTRGRMRPLR